LDFYRFGRYTAVDDPDFFDMVREKHGGRFHHPYHCAFGRTAQKNKNTDGKGHKFDRKWGFYDILDLP
jgi:hypothetical protein